MNPKDQTILDELTTTRNLATATVKNYEQTIKNYTQSQQLPLHELLNEADQEEEQGIRLKNRTLKKRLILFRNHLQDKGLSKGTIQKNMTNIKAIYHHYEIEIPRLPAFNTKQAKEYKPIYYDDLPGKEMIRDAIQLSNTLMKAIILFMVSSGCAREETSSLTVKDFIEATQEYHNHDDIYVVIKELKGKHNIIPTFKLKRRKVNKYYYTFCSPEAVDAILAHLESRKESLTLESRLFNVNKVYMNYKFNDINDLLGGHRKGAFTLFRPHMLRKFHASNLARGENGLTVEEIDSLQGRGKNNVHNSYFLDDPKELKKKYINNIDKVLINTEVNALTIESPEVLKIRKENEQLKLENERIKSEIDNAVDDRIRKVFDEYGIDEILRKHGL